MELLFDPAILLLRIYPKNPETSVGKNTSTPMFTAASFTITKRRKQPESPSVDKWIKKPWSIHTMED